jgi:hypothetical protein
MTVGFSKAELRLTIPFELPPVLLGGGGNSDAASGKISRIRKCFHRASRNLKSIFLED